MFHGFDLHHLDVGGVTLRVRIGGSGPPLLLLHGHPQTHMMWHRVAPRLSDQFRLVIPDLRGYGESSKPPTTDDHEPYSKRAMAQDFVRLMDQLGHESYGVVGHDRGARVAYRLALDHPHRVTRLAVLDIVPTAEMWRFAERSGKRFGLVDYHWYFLAMPDGLPERLITAAPTAYYFTTGRDRFDSEALADYERCIADPATVHAMCEDYRAGAGIDDRIDEADRASGRRIRCPVLVLWAGKDELGEWFDVLETWRRWADDVTGQAIDSSHFMAEEAPGEVAAALIDFLAR
ncbi:MAG: alpha/beta hydrolase [Actinomycetota bacterium]|nr:alpha/beta hydrolase [Actinomycetota bacterium]